MDKARGFNRLGRKSSHRRALQRNLISSLFTYGRVKTTLAKAKEIRRSAEKMITRAKVDSVHNRRLIARELQQKQILNKLFVEISPHFQERAGGYTRVYKLGYRQHDAAELALLELVGFASHENDSSKESKEAERRHRGRHKKQAEQPTTGDSVT